MHNSTKLLGLCLALAFAAAQAQAAVLYKDVTTTDMNALASWSQTRGQDTLDPLSITGADSLRFDQYFAPTANTTYTASLTADLTVGSVRSDYWTTGTAFGNITIGGAYTLTLMGAGDPNYGTSGIVMNAATGGTLTINSNLALGAAQSWTLSRALTVNGNLDLGSYTLTANEYGSSTSRIAGIISGTGGLTKGQSGNLNLAGSNSFTGPTTVSAGILGIGLNGLANSSSVTLNGGSLALGINGTTSINNLSGASGAVIRTDYTISGTNAARTLSVNQTTNGTYAGTFTEGGSRPISLIKTGTATLAFSQNCAYTGGTTINAGVLDLTGGGGSGGTIRGTATVNTGGTLRLSIGDALGYNNDATAVNVINLNGGTLTSAAGSNQTTTAKFHLTGGTINGTVNLDLFSNNSSITTYASANESTISVTTMNLRQNDTVFDIADGAAARDLVISSNIGNGSAGNHNMIKNGAGAMVLTGTNTFTGNVTVSNGVLDLTGGKLYTAGYNNTNTVTVNTGGTLKVKSLVYGLTESFGQLSDYAARRVINGGTLEIVGATHSTGSDFTVGANGGTLRYNPTNTADTMSLTGATADDIQLGGALTIDTIGNVVVSEVITGTGSIRKTGSQTLTLSGGNNYTGPTTVAAGTLEIGGSGSLGSGNYAGTISNAGALLVSTTANQTLSGTISGAGTLTKSGSGTLTLTADNTFTGKVAINGGTVSISRVANLGARGTYRTLELSNGGVLHATDNMMGDRSTEGDQSAFQTRIFKLGPNASGETFAGVIDVDTAKTMEIRALITPLNSESGAGLKKAGAGTLLIARGALGDYTGPTTVAAGTLVVDGSIASSSLTTVNAGATLMGTGTVGATTVNGTLAPGNSIGTLIINGDLVLAGTSDFEIDPNGVLADLAVVSGNLTYGGTLNVTNIGGAFSWGDTFNLFDWGGTLTGNFTTLSLPALDNGWVWQNNLLNDGTITVVPEPAATIGLALLLSGALLRRRRHS